MPTTLRGIAGTLDHSILQPFLTVEGTAGGAYCAMEERDYRALFQEMHPGFFASEGIRTLPEEWTYEEMILPLGEYSPEAVCIPVPEGLVFGWYRGSLEELRRAVARVDDQWPQYFNHSDRVFYATADGELASFCIVEDMGSFRGLKIGGPGCVGTVPEYRRQGIGLRLVQLATGILKDQGYDLSYIHYTAVAPWYAKLGYQTVLKWNGRGFLDGKDT